MLETTTDKYSQYHCLAKPNKTCMNIPSYTLRKQVVSLDYEWLDGVQILV